MSSKEYKWLPHLENSMPNSAHGYTATLYSIALEGWRRGLSLRFIRTNRSKSNTVFELSNKEKTHRFVSSRGDLVTRKALKTCKNKALTKVYLEKNNIPTPKGRDFSEETPDNEIINYAEKIGYPLVIKPLDGTGGHGVIAGITNKQNFTDSLNFVRHELDYKHIIVEEHFEGDDYRVYVVGDEVVAATKRIPANVIGDGNSTIEQLIQRKNKEKKETKLYRTSLIKIDTELNNMLEGAGYNLDSIPPVGEIVYLKSKNNISSGGDPVDATDDLPDKIKDIAIKGLKAIPGLPHGGIDLLVNEKDNKAVIIEINSQASIRLNLFPLKGRGRDIPAKLIDYYFPSTKRNHKLPLYFDFEPVWKEFKCGRTKSVTLPNVPKGKVKLTRFIVTGKVQRVGFGAWVRRKARDLGLHGYINHLRDGSSSIVVFGNVDNVNRFKTILSTENSKRSKVSSITEKSRTTPVPVGFKIKNIKRDRLVKDGYYPVRLEDPAAKKKRKRISRKHKVKASSKFDYEKEYKKIIESTSWKITKPLRILGKLLK